MLLNPETVSGDTNRSTIARLSPASDMSGLIGWKIFIYVVDYKAPSELPRIMPDIHGNMQGRI